MLLNKIDFRWIRTDTIVFLILIFLALWLFRASLSDHTWIGNPDRLNSDLKIMQHYLLHGANGSIDAWNQNEMMGYDSYALPYTFPNPLVPLLKMIGSAKLFSGMGYVMIFLLIAAGISAYAFIRTLVRPGLAALTGAICYQFSALTILKVSQNSMSFTVFIIFPLASLCIRNITRQTAANCFFTLGLLLSSMLCFMFLQKAAYVLIFLSLYAVWCSVNKKTLWPLVIFSFSLCVSVIFATPRIIGIFTAINEYTRTTTGLNFKIFDELYAFQNIQPYQIWRWFDDTIFGRYPSDATKIANNINLTEGFLLHTSAIVPMVIISGIFYRIFSSSQRQLSSTSEFMFFVFMLLFCVLVVICKPITEGVYFLFMKMDFTHARILIIALLPLATLLAMSLNQLLPTTDTKFTSILLGISAALLFYFITEKISRMSAGWSSIGNFPLKVNNEALMRIILNIILFQIMMILLSVKSVLLSYKKIIYITLCALISIECLSGADRSINGKQVFNFTQPFLNGDMYYAKKNEFTLPSPQQIDSLHKKIQPDAYRIALICDEKLANGFCAGHVPQFWKLRAIDGYYGLGVPGRLRMLPWPTNISGLRTVSFSNLEEVPWSLLGFLNVRSLLIVQDGFYRNIVQANNQIIGLSNPNDFIIIPSPARVTPRAFFAHEVKSVKNAQEAIDHIFSKNTINDPVQTSYAEQFPHISQGFSANDSIVVEGQGDRLVLHFNSAKSPRFLILNELYYPGWHAQTQNKELYIFPTNAVMRGIIVPPNVDKVTFSYISSSQTLWAKIFYFTALTLFIGIYFILRFKDK